MMKKLMLTLLYTVSFLASSQVMAQADHSFNYQGELLDGGSPANGTYDFEVTMYDQLNIPVGQSSVHLNIPVENGLFRLNVLIGGLNAFDGFENYDFEIGVREGGSNGNFTYLSPFQRLQAVPLATNLTNGNASTGQVLTFNGFQWAPQTPAQGSGNSPWTTINGGIDYSAGHVNIGGGPNNGFQSAFQVTSNNAEVAAFDGGDQTYVTFSEQGVNIGYIGSFTTASGTEDNDFDIGTFGGNSGSIQLITNASPKMTIRNNGDLKQPNIENNGMMKYMVNANCSTSAGAVSINRSYNGVDDQEITIIAGAGNEQCVIDFPHDINNRYWQVSAVFNASGRGAHCVISAGDDSQLNCYRYNTDTNVPNNGEIMVLVY